MKRSTSFLEVHESKSFAALSGVKARNYNVATDSRFVGIVMGCVESESKHMSLSCTVRFPSFASLMRERSNFWMRAMVSSQRRRVDMVRFGISSFDVDITARVVQ
jgi:hypothetical protein